jgi:DNA-binding NtrC family response regulator
MQGYRWPGNVRELQNTIERAVILSESGRPVSAAALGLPGDMAKFDSEAAERLAASDAVSSAPPANVSAEAGSPAVTNEAGGVLRLDELEKHAIRAALRQTEGNRTKAAVALGISIRTLRNKLQEYRDAGDPVDAGVDTVEA